MQMDDATSYVQRSVCSLSTTDQCEGRKMCLFVQFRRAVSLVVVPIVKFAQKSCQPPSTTLLPHPQNLPPRVLADLSIPFPSMYPFPLTTPFPEF